MSLSLFLEGDSLTSSSPPAAPPSSQRCTDSIHKHSNPDYWFLTQHAAVLDQCSTHVPQLEGAAEQILFHQSTTGVPSICPELGLAGCELTTHQPLPVKCDRWSEAVLCGCFKCLNKYSNPLLRGLSLSLQKWLAGLLIQAPSLSNN